MRSSNIRPSQPASQARCGPAVGSSSVSPGTYGGLETIASKLWVPRPSKRSLRTVLTRTPLRRALIATVASARRETSTAVTLRTPRRAAVMARMPLPVHTSSTDARGSSVCARSASASMCESLMGLKTPGRVMSRTRP
jgi:hypothetical protein